jgi:hypothetical protein
MQASQKKHVVSSPEFEQLRARTRTLCEQSAMLRKQAEAILRHSRDSSGQLRQELFRSSDDLWHSRHRDQPTAPSNACVEITLKGKSP